MTKLTLLLLILSLCHLSHQQQQLYRLVLHPQDRGAACLDGSPPGLYIHEGKGQNKNKFMMYFDSGGFCGAGSLAETLESCYQRSSSSLGTTKNYKPFKSFQGMGLLSPVKQQNPVFYDWTKIFVIYCDGSEYLGNRQTPIEYKSKKLYFRGSKNVLEQFRYMDQYQDFYNGDIIVITGVSAGGMATYEWSNYLVENTKKAKVYGIPDSGFFITDYYSQIAGQKIIRERAINLLNLINDRESLPEPVQKCLMKANFDIVDCLNAGNYMQFLKAPMLIIQSPYDAYSIQCILAVSCLKNKDPPFSLENCDNKNINYIQDYRKATIQYLKKMKGDRNDISLWSPSCVQHGFSDDPSFNNQNYKVKGVRVAEAVQRFLDNPLKSQWLADELAWPQNIGCNGKSSFHIRNRSSLMED